MAGSSKQKRVYICSECGSEFPKWNGRCQVCGAWNSIEELETVSQSSRSRGGSRSSQSELEGKIVLLSDADILSSETRYGTGVGELDRVLGGGLVKGSIVLLGGEPGIGKSTLLLQICRYLGEDKDILYVSGEESVRQIKLRAKRLGVDCGRLYLLAESDAQAICGLISGSKPDIVIIDSIQTMSINEINSAPGSISQVRECTGLFMRTAKSEDIPIFIVGHVNKDGAIAGPKVMEHIVDAVLYFEGERNLSYRILRAVKNRYGSTNEIGVFEMRESGLAEVKNPSQAMLSGRPTGVSGCCVGCSMEGSRPILAEIQALVTRSSLQSPRRTSQGFDLNRLWLILAVLEKRLGYHFGNLDVYVNVVGGLRITEPSADLAVALSLISSLKDAPIDDDIIAFGEIGLGGELRSVSHIEQRIQEAARLGFKKCILPKHSLDGIKRSGQNNIELVGVSNLLQAFGAVKN